MVRLPRLQRPSNAIPADVIPADAIPVVVVEVVVVVVVVVVGVVRLLRRRPLLVGAAHGGRRTGGVDNVGGAEVEREAEGRCRVAAGDGSSTIVLFHFHVGLVNARLITPNIVLIIIIIIIIFFVNDNGIRHCSLTCHTQIQNEMERVQGDRTIQR